jgi:hypothetical protein
MAVATAALTNWTAAVAVIGTVVEASVSFNCFGRADDEPIFGIETASEGYLTAGHAGRNCHSCEMIQPSGCIPAATHPSGRLRCPG